LRQEKYVQVKRTFRPKSMLCSEIFQVSKRLETFFFFLYDKTNIFIGFEMK